MLAMYVVLENHLTMLCDTPAAYEGAPGFEFILKVPATWDEIRVPHAKFNRYVTVARRKGSDWWIGSLNNAERRKLTLPLDFWTRAWTILPTSISMDPRPIPQIRKRSGGLSASRTGLNCRWLRTEVRPCI